MTGSVIVGNEAYYDFRRIAVVSKEFASTIPWTRDNIMIVVPRTLIPALREKIVSGGVSEMPVKYVAIDDEDIATQAAWEVDLEHSGRSAITDEIAKYAMANWNSMFCPWWFAPTILHPESSEWKVQLIIQQTGAAENVQLVSM